jgi:Protein of unknown function (DUF1566).
MKKLFMLFVVFATFFMFVACDNNLKFIDSSDLGDTADTTDTVDTSDSADTSDTSDTTDTADTADTADTSDTGDTTDTTDTANTSDTSDTTDTADTADTSDTGDTEIPIEPDPNYNSPYGSLSLDFAVDQIRNASDDDDSYAGIVVSAFATGTYGNGSDSVVPSDADAIQSLAYYSEDAQRGSSIQVQQFPVYVQGDNYFGGNPLVILDIPEEYAGIGTFSTSILDEYSQSVLYVVDLNWNTGMISCIHAFGEGSITIIKIGNISNHGPLSFNGEISLYSPKNYNGNGDISSMINGITVCDPQGEIALPECGPGSATPCEDPETGYIWSSKYYGNFDAATTYCENNTEGGLMWRVPTISELRTLIQNCSGTEMPNGACDVRDENDEYCLSSDCQEESCYSCSEDQNGGHSIFGEKGWFWSSSPYLDEDESTWVVDFLGADVYANDNSDEGYVRCISDDE